jgi:hypothetical protein
MRRFAQHAILGTSLAVFVFSNLAHAQQQNVVTPSFSNHSSNNAVQPSSTALQPATSAPPVPSEAPLSEHAIEPIANDAADPSTTTTARPARNDDVDIALDPASVIPDLPPIPKQNATLIGGTIEKLDRVRDQIVVRTFGGGTIKISFDPRTHIFRGTADGNAYDLKPGDRVYVDTQLDGDTIFARNIRVKATTSAGEGQGTVISYRFDKGELLLRDVLSPRAVKVRITPETRILQGDRNVAAYHLEDGALVSIKFGPQEDGADVAREVSILALPGSSFTFAGVVTAINLRLGIIVITSSTDHKSYEIYVDPSLLSADDSLHEASNITVLARFDGHRYVARNLTVNSAH